MADLLVWLEGSALGHAMRNAGVWTYGIVNLTHILGVSSLFGAVLVLDLRLLGLWRSIPLASIARPTVPIATTGFIVAATSGLCLISTNGSEYVGNPFLLIKFPAIFVGLLNVAVLSRLPAWKERARALSTGEQRQLSVFGGIALLSWLTAVGAGRLIGYW
ncbi:MAG TPA: hypothetical protein VMS40_15475 [Vicinamibacterales bacterium]|nr:hypothetical protein [Vicinamibacterales bacterium]